MFSRMQGVEVHTQRKRVRKGSRGSAYHAIIMSWVQGDCHVEKSFGSNCGPMLRLMPPARMCQRTPARAQTSRAGRVCPLLWRHSGGIHAGVPAVYLIGIGFPSADTSNCWQKPRSPSHALPASSMKMFADFRSQ